MSVIRRLSDSVRAFSTAWFGPGTPITPQAPPGTEPRQQDYPFGWNIGREPNRRDDRGLTFSQLRNLADSCTILREVIETRKDQIAKAHWSFVPRRMGGESDEDMMRRAEGADPRIDALERFFEKPDGVVRWSEWVRQLSEDALVIDAVVICPDRAGVGGEVRALELLDGATITKLLDERGRTPQDGRVAYQQWVKGLPALDFTSDDLFYVTRNSRTSHVYGYSPVEQLAYFVQVAMRREMFQLKTYTAGNIPAGIVALPETWSAAQVQEFQNYWDVLIGGDADKQRTLRFIPGGAGIRFEWPQKDTLKDEFDEWIARIIAFTFSISPMPFVKQMNRASGEVQKQQADEEGIVPWLLFVKDIIDACLERYWGVTDLEFSWEDAPETDALKQAQIDEIYARIGVNSIDEIRQRLGLDPLGVPAGIITATGLVPFEQTVPGLADEATLAAGLAPGMQPQLPPAPAEAGAQGEPVAPEPVKLAKKEKRLRIRPLAGNVGKRQPVIAARIAKFLRHERHRVAMSVASAYRHSLRPASKLAKQGGDDIAGSVSIDWSQVLDALMPDVAAAWSGAASKGAKGAGGTFDAVNERAVEYADRAAATLVTQVSDTTRQTLRDLVEKALQEGQTPADLARAIEDSGDFAESRAQMIARTELARAQFEGGIAGWREAGGAVMGKQAILSSSHDDYDECDDAAQMGVVPVDDDFGGMGDPPFHPNCECDVIADVSVEEGGE
jgi:hypothetical protein